MFLKSVAGLAIALASGSAFAQQPPRERLTLTDFIARVRADAALRARFAENPRAVLNEYGIDPAPYNLPDRMSDERMDRLLDDLTRSAAQPPQPPPRNPGLQAPVAVYGPPPGQRRP
jgi:hypothetical protein